MRGVFTVVVTTALAIAAVESLSCTQCNSLTNSCINASASECPSDASNSCVSSSANSSLGGKIRMQQEMFCSAADCSGETDLLLAFSVHVSDGERFNFASQCCQEKACDVAYSTLDSPPEDLSSTECPACHGPNATSCIPKPRKCYKEEQCVSLIAQNHDATEMLVLQGCSNISNSICQLLSAGNQRIGIFAFQKVECRDPSDQSADFSIDSRASDPSADFSIDSRASDPSAD
ncbi:ly6/PLAUR domain-containing protein 8, partial [Heterocephalus glaber]|uniref:Ly6/PLAUR domain-containing protein 8 n=1 Tax=Heterocephalus glaber TaxID=10181 RepID=A0AAX6SS48_HETGA